MGNAEYYQNCIDISIRSMAEGPVTGPQLFVANLPGFPEVADFNSGSGRDPGTCYLDMRPEISVPGSDAGVFGRGPRCTSSGSSARSGPTNPGRFISRLIIEPLMQFFNRF